MKFNAENTFSATSPGEIPMQPSPHPMTNPTVFSPSLNRSFRIMSERECAKLCAGGDEPSWLSKMRWLWAKVRTRHISPVARLLFCLQLRLAIRWPVLEPLLPSVRRRIAWDALLDRASLESGRGLRSSVFLSWLRGNAIYRVEYELLQVRGQSL